MRRSTLSLVGVVVSIVVAWLCVIAGWMDFTLLVALMFTVAMAHSGFVSWDHSQDMGRVREALEAIRRWDSVEALSEEAFYRRFADSVDAAQHSVDICYLDCRPPDLPRGSPKARYYRKLPVLVRSHNRVTFRRVGLLTEHTAAWIIEIAGQLRGTRNFSLSVIEEQSPRTQGAISVQCVDDREAYLVAPGEQQPVGPYRDIRLLSHEAAGLLKRYYEGLWQSGKLLVDRGEVDEDYLEDIRRRLLKNAGPGGAEAQKPPAGD